MLVKTDYTETPWIEPGKIYELDLVKGGDNPLYKGVSELGSAFYTRLKKSQHIGLKDWEIVK